MSSVDDVGTLGWRAPELRKVLRRPISPFLSLSLGGRCIGGGTAASLWTVVLLILGTETCAQSFVLLLLLQVGAQADMAADVFAAGLVMYHLLTAGGHPFDATATNRDADAPGGSSKSVVLQPLFLVHCRIMHVARFCSRLEPQHRSCSRAGIQEAIDEYGRDWEKVAKTGSILGLWSASHRDLAGI